MTSRVHDKPYRAVVGGAGDPHCRFRTWSDEEWQAMPPEHQPQGAIRIGGDWAEFLCCDRTDAGVQVDTYRAPIGRGQYDIGPANRARECRRRGVPVDSILVDPSMPGLRDYIRQATLAGHIRTVPADGKRVYIIPLDLRMRLEA